MQRPYDFSSFMASLYGVAFTQDNRIPVISRDSEPDSKDIKAVKSAVCSAEGSYWASSMRDPIFSGWVLKDIPKYRSMFDASNAWSMDQYVKEFLDHRQVGDPMCRALFYNPLLNLTVNSPLTGLPDYVRKEAVCIQALPHVESSFGIYKIFPNGSFLYTIDLGLGYVEGFRSISDMFWDSDNDHVILNVYLCKVPPAEEVVEEEPPRLWCKPLTSYSDFFHSLYYSKLIYGSISEDDFSVIGGGSNTRRRNDHAMKFTCRMDYLIRREQPDLGATYSSKELVVENGRVIFPKSSDKAEGAFGVWTRSGGYALANSIDFSLYHCDDDGKTSSRELRVEFKSV